ncbi:hypothetical protein QBC40DRAFT_336757 [Triangularia verruculosa]|uniref:NACHT domain-containing protein n=1 Tax=Triangularia verruculosa TaxID=2587418 RepID=A0AAN6XU20_9PEZI|nr:hypothetical protein QBC40DRAFT_336757 [Triangularia verruculosa]
MDGSSDFTVVENGIRHDVGLLDSTLPHNDKWTTALERLGETEIKGFGMNTIQGLKGSHKEVLTGVLVAIQERKDECIKKRWKVVIRGRTLILRDVLEKVSVWVSRLLKVGDTLVQYDPQHAAIPWAAIRLILQATVHDVEIFGFVMQSLDTITNLIAYCSIFETRYLVMSDSSDETFKLLSNALVSLYAAILAYLSAVLRRLSQSSVLRFIKGVGSPLSDFETKFEPIHAARSEVLTLCQLVEAKRSEDIQRGVDHVLDNQNKQTGLVQALFPLLNDALQDFRRPFTRFGATLEIIEDGLERQTRAQILKAISTLPYSTYHKNARKGRLEGTGTWLLEHPEYMKWREGSSSSVLWLHGIPGSGKTKLTSLVVDELGKHDNLAYFYCIRNPAELERAQCESILASLVRQMAGASVDKSILPQMVARYEDSISGISEFDDQAWTTDESTEMILELLEEYPSATIIIDALDEVNQEERQELLDILSQLLRESPNLLKIFISSRDNYDIALHFEGLPNVYIDVNNNASDISSFIDERLKAARLLHGRLPRELQLKITQALRDGARGMFRWVDLQIQSLRPLKLASDIKARLGRLPATLEESYWQIYQELLAYGEHASELAKFTFQWLMYVETEVPIDSFVYIASYGMTITDHGKQLAPITKHEVMDVCSNLVTLREFTFEFAHLSVREFLESLSRLHKIDDFLPERSHACIASACLRHMMHRLPAFESQLLRDTKKVDEDPEDDIDGDNGEGVGQQDGGPEALSTEDSSDVEEDSLIRLFTTITVKRNLQESESDILRSEGDDIAHTKSAEDAEIKSPTDVSIDIRSATPESRAITHSCLMWASHVSKSGETWRTSQPLAGLVQAFLLEAPSTVANTFTLWCRWTSELSDSVYEMHDSAKLPPNPIWLACFRQWLEVVEYLCSANYDGLDNPRRIYEFDHNEFPDGISPLWYAVKKRHQPMIDVILKHCADPLQTKAAGGVTPLVASARDGEQETTEKLLRFEHGGLENEIKALAAAAEKGNVEIMQILERFNPDVVHKGARQALVEAGKSGALESVRFVFDRGAWKGQVEASFFYPPVYLRHLPLVRFLLEKGVGGRDLMRALTIAVSDGDTEMSTLLIENGAEMDRVAVVRAVRSGTPVSALRLVKAGYNIKGHYFDKGRTSLHYAVEQPAGFEPVVKALIEAGTAVDACDRSGHTALHIAAAKGNKACVELLLNHGADVLMEDKRGRIPLDLAEDKRHTSTVELIRSHMTRMMKELQRERAARGVSRTLL